MKPQLENFVKKHQSLFWYTPKERLNTLNEGLIVETLLNYGTLDDIKELTMIMGKKQIATVFFSAKERQKLNYYPEIYHFFSLIFAKYA